VASLRGDHARLITIDGSSTVFPITEAAAEDFQRSHRGQTRIIVGISGTGGGFKKFCRGETDIQDASRPITAEEREVCRRNGVRYYELPIAHDASTIVVSRQNSWVHAMTIQELKRVWEPSAQGRVSRWSQIRPDWPDAPLKLFGAGSDSGTFDYFTEVVVGRPKASRGDFTASEDDNTLVQGIARDPHALGYIPFGYYESNQHKLRAVAVDAGSGAGVPTRQGVEQGTYHPLSRPLLIYVNDQSADRPEVRAFVESYLNHAARFASEVNFIPLPADVSSLAVEYFRSRRLGTVFGGGLTGGRSLAEVLRQQASL
jgi:phosphate transport system substrate-binding protein